MDRNDLTHSQARYLDKLAQESCNADTEWRSLSALVDLCLAQGWANVAIAAEDRAERIKAEYADHLMTDRDIVEEVITNGDREDMYMTKGTSHA